MNKQSIAKFTEICYHRCKLDREIMERPGKAIETVGESPDDKGGASHVVASICVTSTGDGAHEAYAANLVGRNAKA